MHGGLLIGGSIEVVIQRENERNILFLCFWARLSYPSTTSSALYRSLQRQRLLVLNVKNSTNTILECSFSYSLPVCYVAYERIKLGNYSNKPPPPEATTPNSKPVLCSPPSCYLFLHNMHPGHYARTSPGPDGDGSKPVLLEASDSNKDQTYFLCGVPSEGLAKVNQVGNAPSFAPYFVADR